MTVGRGHIALCQSKHLPFTSSSNEQPLQKAEQACQQMMQHTDLIDSTSQVMHCQVSHAARVDVVALCLGRNFISPALQYMHLVDLPLPTCSGSG